MGSSIWYVCKIFRKTYISYPMISARSCAYQEGKKCYFFRKFCVRTKWMIPIINHDNFCRIWPQTSVNSNIYILSCLENENTSRLDIISYPKFGTTSLGSLSLKLIPLEKNVLALCSEEKEITSSSFLEPLEHLAVREVSKFIIYHVTRIYLIIVYIYIVYICIYFHINQTRSRLFFLYQLFSQ